MEVGGEVWGRADQQEKRKLKGGHAEQWADFSDFEQETVNNSWPSFFCLYNEERWWVNLWGPFLCH